MPIYEYVCRACGKQSEIIQKISDRPEKKCPLCGKPKLEKLMSASGFRLKGGGWYETDFKSGDKKKNVAGDTDAPAAPAPAAADKPAKADAPAAKSEKAEKAKPVEKPKKPEGKPAGKKAAS